MSQVSESDKYNGKYCVDCMYSDGGRWQGSWGPACKHPESQRTTYSPVYGPNTYYSSCNAMRTEGFCGIEGKYYAKAPNR